ncbi:uncharacterized protein LAESUDRAFT_720919 [Laetiporus sulphureus 93-53]|uniref:Uncharacterized protein n=1 Tax=Laetiporus sulphureus 93-53 TaxID=1314785 RepID=A0A165GNB9_9APHY|nr:uncharacterized protein LAESUDRAFT_720919 [Laetiporus sulphureus 93-53]KZT10584.1 hypothetical protein LAESUDRAFT_720919 [Laetiporus sulphureus 93-53]
MRQYNLDLRILSGITKRWRSVVPSQRQQEKESVIMIRATIDQQRLFESPTVAASLLLHHHL